MHILVSFCNLRSLPGRPALGLFNADTMDLRVLKLPVEVPQGIGMMGLAISSQFVFVGLQVSGGTKAAFSPPGLLIFNRSNFSLVHHYTFGLVKDIHSFWLSKDEARLYVVSTGTDEVIEVKLERATVVAEKFFWRPEPEGVREDVFHINCIYEWQGDLVISGFGKKTENEEWNSARNGFIFNISQNKTIVSGIEHPHSFAGADGRLAYCESRKRQLCFVNDKDTITLPGYARGLCIAGDKLFAGTSASRKKSKSTGKLNKSLGIDGGECSISQINLRTPEIEKTVNLRKYGEEIYELLPVEGTADWPVYNHDNFYPFDEAWEQQYQRAVQELKEVIAEGETLILVDDNVWDANAVLSTFRRLHFLDRAGTFWGTPSDCDMAIKELETMRLEQKAKFIAFGWPSFWWFDHYKDFYSYLSKSYRCILDNDHVVVFNLNEPVSLF
ncbi:MAG TPA: DUF4915 domain-containing protein [Flavisolibacter sp.]|nr:DUF4915 domain-containing protein [Flavisolibacter sp.]